MRLSEETLVLLSFCGDPVDMKDAEFLLDMLKHTGENVYSLDGGILCCECDRTENLIQQEV